MNIEMIILYLSRQLFSFAVSYVSSEKMENYESPFFNPFTKEKNAKFQ